MRQIGSYVVVIEDGPAAGQQHEFIGDTGRPHAGEPFELDGLLYVVVEARHQEDTDAHTTMRYSFVRILLRFAGQAAALSTDGDEAPTTVLPFAGPVDGPRTTTLLPPSLVAVLVVAGYSEQKVAYRLGKRRLAQLRRGRWVAADPGTLWRLSRRAKRFMLEAANFALELTDDELTWSSSSPLQPELRPWSVLQDLHLDASRRVRSQPPALRLV
ncbi:MAG: hypothetical protein JWM53_5776 [bacterium]|nr:hypothetical protein [bacterium]